MLRQHPQLAHKLFKPALGNTKTFFSARNKLIILVFKSKSLKLNVCTFIQLHNKYNLYFEGVAISHCITNQIFIWFYGGCLFGNAE